jgi:hypothetical protein
MLKVHDCETAVCAKQVSLCVKWKVLLQYG